MLNWYNKKASKNTITRYLSNRYSLEELQNLTYLELPEQFESLDYADELNLVLKDSPWKASEVKSVYFEADSEISLPEQIAQKTANIQTAQAKLAGKTPKESWETEEGLKNWIKENEKQKEELEAQSLLTYQFRLNQASLIVLWKKADQEWEEEPYQGCFLDLNKTYRNCWITVQTVRPLPTELPEGVNCLFELVATQEELLKKNDWDYGLVKEVEPVEESESSDYELSESESEPELKGTYRYEFKTDNQGLIINWRTPNSFWLEDCPVYRNKYFALDVAKYANSDLKVKTLEPLPRDLPNRYLFAPSKNEKDFYSKEPNWINCLVWEQSSNNTNETPTNPLEWWNNNKNWVIVTGVTVLLILLWKE